MKSQDKKFRKLMKMLSELEKANNDSFSIKIDIFESSPFNKRVKPYFMLKVKSLVGRHCYFSAEGRTIDGLLNDALKPRPYWLKRYKYFNQPQYIGGSNERRRSEEEDGA